MPQDSRSTDYINTLDYTKVEDKLRVLREILEDKAQEQLAARKLRYADVDVEAERAAGRIAPDELYVPQHIIDTNIRREQSAYIQYITQSPRAIITSVKSDKAIDMSLLDEDLTQRIRFEGWQTSMFANVDAFQGYGYSCMEIIQDLNNPGEVGHEAFPYADFAFLQDTKDIQTTEFVGRQYYFTKTKLLGLCGDPLNPDPEKDWDKNQVDKIISQEPDSINSETARTQDRSLYRVIKAMFRVNGIVHVAWCYPKTCDNWLRKPKPLYLGMRQAKPMEDAGMMSRSIVAIKQMVTGVQPSVEQYETRYPYVIFPYLISENDIITELKGRIYLDQDLQEAVTSLMSSTCTQARRAAGLYASRDTSDPNDDFMMQKNIYLRSGCIVNSKLNFFQVAAPDPGIFSSIQALIAGNQNETSQVNFAALNRKDSRKTAKEISVSERQEQILSTVQVVLFCISLTQLYRRMTDIIKSRVLFGLIQDVKPDVIQLYKLDFMIKPSGDVDVLEKQQLIQSMREDWPVIQNTPAAPAFLMDYIEIRYPDRAAKYNKIITDQIAQGQSAQAQQQQQLIGITSQLANGIVELSKHKDFFSEVGQLHAYPVIQQTADKLKEMHKQITDGNQQQQKAAM